MIKILSRGIGSIATLPLGGAAHSTWPHPPNPKFAYNTPTPSGDSLVLTSHWTRLQAFAHGTLHTAAPPHALLLHQQVHIILSLAQSITLTRALVTTTVALVLCLFLGKRQVERWRSPFLWQSGKELCFYCQTYLGFSI